MNFEIECKIQIESRETVSEIITAAGGADFGDKLEQNWVYDTENNNLRQSSSLLRIRSYDKNIITFKGPYKESAFKKREELECSVDSIENIKKIFERLGYRQVWYYEKYRHKFKLDSAEIVLDKVPELGNFIEIEADSEAAVRKLLEKLGLKEDCHINKSYLQIFAEKCSSEGRELRDMKF
ncbi:MAG: class IV adenylate cyclase [Planctomycetota bacterium]|jgi:predicted adenylyl cyclase CyaB